MHRIATLSLLFLTLCVGCGAPANGNPDESKEPPLQFIVTVGNRSVAITEGETVRLDGAYTDPTITVTPQPFRVFRCQGISFKYPRSFTFEADLADPDAKTWTLSGNDFKIMFFVSNSPLTSTGFADGMIEQFGRENCRVIDANAKITLAGQPLSGTTIRITVATHELVQDIYQLPSRGGVTRLLVLQDSLDDARDRTSEGRKTLKELESSFTIER